MKQLQEVEWGRNYPHRIEKGNYILKRKNWGFRLIYDVYLAETGEYLGTCHVMQKANFEHKCKCTEKCSTCKCENKKFVVKELVSKLKKLERHLERIEAIIRESI